MTVLWKVRRNFMYGTTVTYDHDSAPDDTKNSCMVSQLPTHIILSGTTISQYKRPWQHSGTLEKISCTIARIFNETDLLNLHHHRYPTRNKPATYQRGSNPIDIMLGSPLLARALTQAWILLFGEPPMIKGDTVFWDWTSPQWFYLEVQQATYPQAWLEELTVRMINMFKIFASKWWQAAMWNNWTSI